ncbi:TPA: tetratricopeptide repeat protein, partial [Candidatus Poribacteria bacterium]|nr:tetratricopeptide repeat protein [Candidatus Poribacteria bacterium]
NLQSSQFDINRLFEQAIQHHQSGQLEQAKRKYQEILDMNPQHADSSHLLGLVEYQHGNYVKAVERIQQAVLISPEQPVFFNNLGNVLKEMGQLDRSVQAYQRALEIAPDDAEIHNNLGVTLKEMGQLDRSVQAYQRALEIAPDDAEIHNNLGVTLKEMGQLDRSVQSYQQALKINPQYAEAYNNLGNVLKEMERLDESLQAYQEALEINPQYVEVYNNLGNVLKEMERLNESIQVYQKALEINPQYAPAYSNLGNTLEAKGELDQSIQVYQKALEINPQYAEAHKNLSLSLLKLGNFKQGWEEYQWRWKCDKFAAENRRDFPQPMWDGSSLDGKSIIIWQEQGTGDHIMFASLLVKLQEQAQRIFVETEHRLLPILERSFPTIHFRTVHIPPDPQLLDITIDFQSPIASLPQWFLTNEEDFPKRQAYLKASDHMKQRLRHKYQQLAEGKTLIGISWKSVNKNIGKQKSAPLKQWETLLSSKDCFFINLQYEYGDFDHEFDQFANATGISIYCDKEINPLENLDDFAAQVAALDLVITISNTTAHVAGALGKSVWTLLHYGADWRWLTDRSDTPWYPSMTLFRQKDQGDWGSVFQQIHTTLKGYKPAG